MEYVSEEAIDLTVSQLAEATYDVVMEAITGPFMSGSPSQIANASMDTVGLATKGYEFVKDMEIKELQEEVDKLRAEEDAYEQEMLDKPYMQSAGVFSVTHEALSSPDTLQDLAIDIESRVGQDKSFQAWYSDVNS